MNNDKFESLKEKQTQLRKLKKEINELSNDAFTEFIKVLFTKNPKLESFSWTQYTPYFNDGESCVFSVNTDYIKINGEYADEQDWISPKTIINYGKWNSITKKYVDREEIPNPNYDEELSKVTDEIRDFLSQFDEDFYHSQYGDHVEITVTSQGVNISEHEHE